MYEIRRYSRVLPTGLVVPTPNQLGPELILNGDFSSSVGWTLVGATITGGELVADGFGQGRAATLSLETLTAGTYRYSFTIVSTDGFNFFFVTIGGTSSGDIPGTKSPGTFTGTVDTLASQQSIIIECPFTVYHVDNFSVRRVL